MGFRQTTPGRPRHRKNQFLKTLGACGLAALLIFTSWPVASRAFAKKEVVSADWVLVNAAAYTLNPNQPWAEAIAIKDGAIVYVGDNAGALDLKSAGTRVTDLGGKMVLPGLVESHTHPGLVGLFSNVTPIPNPDPSEIPKWLGKYARKNPDLPVILAGSWRLRDFGVNGPHKKDLDAVVSDRPVILLDDFGHSVWVNSKALEAIGVNHNTPDPVPGLSFFVRDEDNEPTGWIKEFAQDRLAQLAVQPGDYFEPTVIDFLDYLVSQGITILYDAGNLGWDDKVYSLLARLEKEGKLPLRYEGSYHVYLPEHFNEAVSELKRLRRDYGGERLTFNTIKIHYDGINEVRTSALTEPFSDDPDNRGVTLASEEQLADFIRELSEERIDLHIHTVGDRAIHQALNAYETVKRELGDELYTRLTLCHLEVMLDTDMSRFKELGVIANFTPQWMGEFGFYEPGSQPNLGDRAANKMRSRTMLTNGTWVTFSSDIIAPGPDRFGRANPYLGMQAGHTRQEPYLGPDAVTVPPFDERIGLEDLIRGYTLSGAFQLRRDNQIGSIETGKSADLVILHRNLFELDRYEIKSPKVAMTVMEGEVIYERTWWIAIKEWFTNLMIWLYASTS